MIGGEKAIKTKRRKNDIYYKTEMEFEQKGRMKVLKLGVRIKPRREKHEDKEAFMAKKEEIFQKIVHNMKQY